MPLASAALRSRQAKKVLTIGMVASLLISCADGDASRDSRDLSPACQLFRDRDGDGFGAEASQDCSLGLGWVSRDGDCDDDDATTSPAALEVCDGADNDCDGELDEGLNPTCTEPAPQCRFYRDADGDGVGSEAIDDCSAGIGWVPKGGDCDDSDARTSPEAGELCDQLDNDCDGEVDEDARIPHWPDCDGDGHGNLYREPFEACRGEAEATPAGCVAVPVGDDCNDTRVDAFPGAPELCDRVDNDCDGTVDEGLTERTWYLDCDGDRYAGSPTPTKSCGHPPPKGFGYVCGGTATINTFVDAERMLGTDCNDRDTRFQPAQSLFFHEAGDFDCDGTLEPRGFPPELGPCDAVVADCSQSQPTCYTDYNGQCGDVYTLLSSSQLTTDDQGRAVCVRPRSTQVMACR